MPPSRAVALCLLPLIAAARLGESSATGSDADHGPAPSGLAVARELFLEGYYDKARETYAGLLTDPLLAIAAHVGLTAIDEQTGRYREALERLHSVKDGERSADWQAAAAAMCARLGEDDAALAHGRRALALNPGHTRARRQLGRLLERLGRRQEAIDVYAWFSRQAQESLPDRAEDLADLGDGFLRHTILTRHENLKARLKYVLQDVYQEAFDVVDKRYWPARLAAAELLLDKHNLGEAEDDLRAVLQVNGQAADAHVGLARIALERWDWDGAESQAEQALAINPNSCGALLALGRARMLERRYPAAAEIAERMLKVNPRSLEALALKAAALTRGERPQEAAGALAAAAAIAPRSAFVENELGVWLSAGRQYGDAEARFKRAIEFDPTWSEPQTQLGLMYMQSGHEPEARRTLEASWRLDSFNHETYHVLELLDELEKFAQVETGHFVLKFDATDDAALGPVFGHYLERIYPETTREFGAEPPVKTTIEVFPAHARFSVRVTGRPWIATVGACTGPVIAMDAPRRGAAIARFNWADVLRHEFAHTVTLAATENRIPHWMTEGLAVYAEHVPRSWFWMKLLGEAIAEKRLFTLESVDWGFMRPRRTNDRALAYAQSEWMIEYIVERHGEKAIGELLAAFRARQSQEQAFRGVLKTPTREFSTAFHGWARRQAEGWGVPLDPPPDERKLKALLLVAPESGALNGQMAELLLQRNEADEADKHAEKALRIDPKCAAALRVRGSHALNRAEAEEVDAARTDLVADAAPLVRRLVDLRPDDPIGVWNAARLDQQMKAWDDAVRGFERYVALRPFDPDGYRRLAGSHLMAGRDEAALPHLVRLYELTRDEADTPRKIAAIHAASGDDGQAADWLWRAIEIDPYDADAYQRAGALCEKLGRLDEAAVAYRAFAILRPGGDGEEALKRVTSRPAGQPEPPP